MSFLDSIEQFKDDYRWLSNFWPCTVIYNDILFDCVEKAYVAAKTNDKEVQLIIRSLPTPGAAKRFGRYMEIIDQWDLLKYRVMQGLIYQKFRPGSELSKKLLLTGDKLIIEGNTWGDTYWGKCNGVGYNNLGKIIMKQRSLLRHFNMMNT